MSGEPTVTSGGTVATGMSGFLEFEKPLLRIQHDIDEMQREQTKSGHDLVEEIKAQRVRFDGTLKRLYSSLTPWETVLVARHPKRPLSTDYLRMIFRDFAELHGDRTFGDDKAIITGLARIGGHKVMVIGHNKGKDVAERIACNFGCAHPEGYRKSLAKMRLAAKYHLPVVCLIDTQGAYPGIGAEERGISHAIAVNLMEMSRLRTPVVCIIIGEGGSGGALGLGVGDRVAIMQHSFYSVISPEGCAAILWKTAEQRKHAAEALKLTAKDLRKLDLVDEIIPEPEGGAHRDPEAAAANLETYIVSALDELKRRTIGTLLRRRQDRVRNLGNCFIDPSAPKSKPASTVGRKKGTKSRTSRLSTRLLSGRKVTA